MIDKEKFESILKRKDLKEYLLGSSKESIEKAFGEDVARMIGYEQNNPHHQYNLFEHTVEVMENLPDTKYSEEDYISLRAASLLHDVGKPNVAKEKGGKTTYYNHAEESKKIATEILKEIGYTDDEVKRIDFFIAHHDDFINISSIDDKTVEKLSKIIEKMKAGDYVPSNKDQAMLLDLCRADAKAQSEVILEAGEVKDTRQGKLDRYDAIEERLPEARIFKEAKDLDEIIDKKKKELSGYTVAPEPIVKSIKGKEIVVNQKQIDNWNKFNEKPEEEKEALINSVKKELEEAKAKKDELLKSLEEQEKRK